MVSEVEANLFRQFGPKDLIHVMPNGVDLDYFAPRDAEETTGCVFVGALDYKPNVEGAAWFCKQVWPELHRRYPQARASLSAVVPLPPSKP